MRCHYCYGLDCFEESENENMLVKFGDGEFVIINNIRGTVCIQCTDSVYTDQTMKLLEKARYDLRFDNNENVHFETVRVYDLQKLYEQDRE